jgi:hypothetical protein
MSETKTIAVVAFLAFLMPCLVGAYLVLEFRPVEPRYVAAGGVGLSLSAWAASRASSASVSPWRVRLFGYATFVSVIAAVSLLFVVGGSPLPDLLRKDTLLPGFLCSLACAIAAALGPDSKRFFVVTSALFSALLWFVTLVSYYLRYM